MFDRKDALVKGQGEQPRIVFGPVQSTRLGLSLGVDNLRGKRCSYGCSYCEVSQGVQLQRSRQRFYEPAAIVDAARYAIDASAKPIDYVTIVPAGEPTLDANLGAIIDGLKELNVRVAVFTNGSLLSRDDVRRELCNADWVSIKVDAADRATWKRINGPLPGLDFELVTQGMRVFAASFRGKLATETMLVDGVNTSRTQLEATADLVSMVGPFCAYLNTPSRQLAPPPAGSTIATAKAIFDERLRCVQLADPGSDRPSGRRFYWRRKTEVGAGPRRASLPVLNNAV